MKSMLALIRREQLEHRGAFFYAPTVLLLLFAGVLASAFAFNRIQVPLTVSGDNTLKFFSIAFLGMGFLWSIYLMVALFFYFADAFNADRRNNAMLFWKSMPQSDFKILMSKMLAALTVFPAQIFALLVVTGFILYGTTAAATLVIPALTIPSIPHALVASGQVLWFCLAYGVLALLWYSPFFAWVGMLSTMFGRWSIPLAFLLPGLVVLGENLFVRGFSNLIMPADGLRGGQVLAYLRERSSFGLDERGMFENAMDNGMALDITGMLNRLVAGIDWLQLGGGILVAVLLVFVASEYRRRVILT